MRFTNGLVCVAGEGEGMAGLEVGLGLTAALGSIVEADGWAEEAGADGGEEEESREDAAVPVGEDRSCFSYQGHMDMDSAVYV